ncbi:MAG TPA: hypothetical protein ENJ28_12130 [Gammaproteobacteria bacterium]|nr:hypothetical protein [Gammaproteobacteria bacterium]
MAISKLIGIELELWANIIRIVEVPYNFVIGNPFSWVQQMFQEIGIYIGNVWRDIIVVWISSGRLVRRCILDLASYHEERYIRIVQNKNPLTFREKLSKLFSNPRECASEWWKRQSTKEAIKFTFFPLGRIWVDVRAKYWSLSPQFVFVYFFIASSLLGVLVLIDIPF